MASAVHQVAEKWSDVVILSEAKNLLFARGIENKADSSARQKAPGFRMTPQRAFSATSQAARKCGSLIAELTSEGLLG